MPDITDEPMHVPSQALFKNLGPDTIYLGPLDMTTDDGFPVAAGEAVVVGHMNESLYAVAAATETADVRILPRALGHFTFTPPA